MDRRKAVRSNRGRATVEHIEESELLKRPLAKEALDKLVKHGAERQAILSRVLRVPFASKKVQRLVPVIDDRTLRRIPDQIKKLAENIQRVHRSPYFDPNLIEHRTAHFANHEKLPAPLNLTLKPEFRSASMTNFLRIPTILYAYAEHLRAWLDLFHPTGLRRRELGIGYGMRPRTVLILDVLSLVRHSTGKPHFTEVATLLEAAFVASRRPGGALDATSLYKLEKNNQWLVFVVSQASLKNALIPF